MTVRQVRKQDTPASRCTVRSLLLYFDCKTTKTRSISDEQPKRGRKNFDQLMSCWGKQGKRSKTRIQNKKEIQNPRIQKLGKRKWGNEEWNGESAVAVKRRKRQERDEIDDAEWIWHGRPSPNPKRKSNLEEMEPIHFQRMRKNRYVLCKFDPSTIEPTE